MQEYVKQNMSLDMPGDVRDALDGMERIKAWRIAHRQTQDLHYVRRQLTTYAIHMDTIKREQADQQVKYDLAVEYLIEKGDSVSAAKASATVAYPLANYLRRRFEGASKVFEALRSEQSSLKKELERLDLDE